VFNGEPAGLFIYGAGKARAIEQLAAREGIDLAVSYAYSDSQSDLPMLRLVGHPVVVNPDAELRRIAREEGWEVLRFERLGRRFKAAAALAGAAVAGGAGSAALALRGRRRTFPQASDRLAARAVAPEFERPTVPREAVPDEECPPHPRPDKTSGSVATQTAAAWRAPLTDRWWSCRVCPQRVGSHG
jgi:hypothetical protein